MCDSPSTCLSENQYIWVPESCLSLLGRQMLGSDYKLVPRAFPLENGRSAKALTTRIKLTAKTAGTKILLVVSVGSLEKRSNQPKHKESKTRSPRTIAKLIQNNVYFFFHNNIWAGHTSLLLSPGLQMLLNLCRNHNIM